MSEVFMKYCTHRIW